MEWNGFESVFLVYGMDLQYVIRWTRMAAIALVIFSLCLPFIGFFAMCLCAFGVLFSILLASSVLCFAFLLQLEASAPAVMKPLLGFIAWVLLHFFCKISGFNGQLENQERSSSGDRHHVAGSEEGISFEEEESTVELEHSEGHGSIQDINEVGDENFEASCKYRIGTVCKHNEYESYLYPSFVEKTSHEINIVNPVVETSYNPENIGEQRHKEVYSVQFGDSNSKQRLIQPVHIHGNGVCQLGEEEVFSSCDEVAMKFLRVNCINGRLDPRWGSSNNYWRRDYLRELEALRHVGVSATEARRLLDEFAEDRPPTQFHKLLEFWQRKEREILKRDEHSAT